MRFVVPILLLALGGVFGVWGWRRGTRDVVYLPGRHADRPIGVGREEWERTLGRRFRRRRILLTIGGAIGIPAAAFAVLMIAAVLRR